MKTLHLNGIIDVNCYIIEVEDGVYVIDPGSDREVLADALKDLKVKGVLLTHGHADHIGCLDLFNCPIYLHELEKPMLFDDSINCFKMLRCKPEFNPYKLDIRTIKDQEEIDGIKIIHTPGHTRGSVSYLYKNKLFSGDTLFKLSIGRTDLPTGSIKDMKLSIKKLMELDDNIMVYPGHDEKTTIKMERQNNPYYLNWNK